LPRTPHPIIIIIIIKGHPQAWAGKGALAPLEMLESVLCITSYSQTLSSYVVLAHVLRATTNKGRQIFLKKKVKKVQPRRK